MIVCSNLTVVLKELNESDFSVANLVDSFFCPSICISEDKNVQHLSALVY